MNAEQNRAKSIFLNAAEIAARADQEAYIAAQYGDDEALRRTGPEAVSKRGLAHLPCGACPRFETASQRWPELAESVPREKMLSWFG